ncbi:hypothetical protein ACFLTT_03290 [Chloroflexota bacterium]
MKELLIYLLAIIIAESVTNIINPTWGMLCHIILLFAIIVHSALSVRQVYWKLLLSISLVPLIRIVSLSMPLAHIPQIWWYIVIYLPLLLAAITVIRILGIKIEDIGIRLRFVPIQLLVALSGVLLGLIEYLILKPESVLIDFTWQ